MYVSNDLHVLRDFDAQSKRAHVFSGAFSPLGHSFAQELITNPAHADVMRNLDTVGIPYDVATLKGLKSGFTYRGDTRGIMLFNKIPGEGPGRDALVWDLIDGLKAIDSNLENTRARILVFWTHTGVTDTHPHEFVTAVFNMAGLTTLTQDGRKFPPNSIGLIPPGMEHASPVVPVGMLRLSAVALRFV